MIYVVPENPVVPVDPVIPVPAVPGFPNTHINFIVIVGGAEKELSFQNLQEFSS